MLQTLVRRFPALPAALALGSTSALSVAMVLVRWGYTDRLQFRFIIWNLILAWIPLCCALLASRAKGRLALLALASTWLLFFPNAPYVLTDLMHFRVRDVPYWYDLIMLISFAWTGTLAGYLSLYLMHQRMSELLGNLGGWAFAFVTLALGSFGIYLGRFERWNSWDVLVSPLDIARDIWSRISNPFDHERTYVFTLLLALFMTGAYLTLYAFARMPRESTVK
jgi:uncharacterized membrane protein